MRTVSMEEQVRVLSLHPLDANGQPTIDREEAIRIVRGHVELDELEYYTDAELWRIWNEDAASVGPDGTNARVVDLMAARIRTGM